MLTIHSIYNKQTLENKYLTLLHKQESNERYKQICPEHEEEIEWLELPVRNGRLDDIPYCATCKKPLREWFVLDSLKDMIVASGVLREDEEDD